MILRLTSILIIVFLIAGGCNTEKECEKNNTGELIIINSNPDPYYLEMDGLNSGTMEGDGLQINIELPVGEYDVGMIQNSGYAVEPAIFSMKLIINECESQVWAS